ncbi:molybdate ABC transporter substrate-binding protein [Desulfopila sp. IMCC35006]|uniref:molybdate ABC transporter substrate-binding protein n=1 Tax=Desulfopila sp. IMCC35006 TaxID=2569542 RepID=UPI0010AD0CBB|nr:molybdate ABC transporter substrate-binding protein [Desulfopila sp. IMCC35006]TKB25210.1 molybdate ABC transporter substrate-binding protein [Desulfopila sp. IMCC35006]
MKVKMLFAVLLFQICTLVGAQARIVHLSVAASMTDAFNAITAGFTAQHPEAEFQPNFASSGSLAKQIEQGAPADIYVSANPKWMKYLLEKQLIEPGTDRVFAYNKLVFVGEKKATDLSMQSLATLDRIALGSPQNVPAGQYARQAMEHVGVYTTLEQEKKLVMAKDVRQALLYADRGEVDGAFVYRTDALLATNAIILFTVPDTLYDRVSYPMALTITGAQNALAKEFYAYLTSPEAIAILNKYGFESN